MKKQIKPTVEFNTLSEKTQLWILRKLESNNAVYLKRGFNGKLNAYSTTQQDNKTPNNGLTVMGWSLVV